MFFPIDAYAGLRNSSGVAIAATSNATLLTKGVTSIDATNP